MADLNSFLTSVFHNAGIAVDDARIKDLVSNTELTKISFPDEVANEVHSRLMTMEAAKNNSDLKKHFTASALDGIDKRTKALFDELGLDDETRNELLGIQSTYDRIPALVKKVQALEASKAGKSATDKDALNAQIKELNKQILDIKAHAETEKTALLNDYKGKLQNMQLLNLINSMDLSSDAINLLGKDMVVETAHKRFLDALKDKGLSLTDNDGRYTLVKADGTGYYENNKEISLNDFLKNTLATHKLLSTGTTGNGATPNNPVAPRTTSAPDGNRQPSAASARASQSNEATRKRLLEMAGGINPDA